MVEMEAPWSVDTLSLLSCKHSIQLSKTERLDSSRAQLVDSFFRRLAKKCLLRYREDSEHYLRGVRIPPAEQGPNRKCFTTSTGRSPRIPPHNGGIVLGDEPAWIVEQLNQLTTKFNEPPPVQKKRTRRGLTRDANDLLLLDRDDHFYASSDDSSEEEVNPCKRQVIFCSRTHSQLSQFIGEFKKTCFPSSLSVVVLASRKSLCINENVRQSNSVSLINERCLDLQEKKSSKKTKTASVQSGKLPRSQKGGCPYYSSQDTASSSSHGQFVSQILSEPLDIENLGSLGQSQCACPYYASRSAVKKADVILLPYTSLLSEDTRESLGISLEGNILIIDEAHNLMDAINTTHKSVIDEGVLRSIDEMLKMYSDRFETSLSEMNNHNLKILSRIVEGMLMFCANYSGNESKIKTVNEFLFDTGLDNINFLKSVRWIQESKLSFKVSSYQKSRTEGDESGNLNKIFNLVSFLKAFHYEDQNGRVMVEQFSRKRVSELRLTFLLLDPSVHFQKLMKSCHSVVLTSGTLSPLSLIKTQLFKGDSSLDRVVNFSCSHIVSKDHILAFALTHGSTGRQLDSRYETRSKRELLDEVGTLILKLCDIIPEGFVVFVPSFAYLETLIHHLNESQLFNQINQKKSLFIEPREIAKSEETFRQYKEHCLDRATDKNGSILLSVVGGKMSEGINFGDELGRCVLMIGLPYSNLQDPELLLRKDFLIQQDGITMTGHQYYEDLCMKAVNQSIGRVIRHAGDYACIILADYRYSNNRIIQKLPNWIQSSFAGGLPLQQALPKMVNFFEEMKIQS